MFQSAPAFIRRENPRRAAGGISRKIKFQSAPAFIRRENARTQSTSGAIGGFNPLPPLSGGRTWMGPK